MLADPLTKDFNGPKMTAFTDKIFDKKIFWFKRECQNMKLTKIFKNYINYIISLFLN